MKYDGFHCRENHGCFKHQGVSVAEPKGGVLPVGLRSYGKDTLRSMLEWCSSLDDIQGWSWEPLQGQLQPDVGRRLASRVKQWPCLCLSPSHKHKWRDGVFLKVLLPTSVVPRFLLEAIIIQIKSYRGQVCFHRNMGSREPPLP